MKYVLAALLFVFAGAPLGAAEPVLQDLSTYPKGEVTVQSATGAQRFDVWIADTADRQRQGLMFVRDLPASQGMLFVNESPRRASFWMKNTFIPLDLLFFDARGRLIAVFENATPLSLDPMGPDMPVKWILELRGGESRRRGLKPGDVLQLATPRKQASAD
ncbi:MAG: hypothetical protein RL245_166 [Pseudomonadota bacterium]